MSPISMNPMLPFCAGVAAFGISQLFWSATHRTLFDSTQDWVLEPNAGVALCLLMLAAASATMCAIRGNSDSLKRPMLSVGLGAFLGCTVALFIIGPGNLWPIVLVFDAVLIVVAVVVGGFIGNAYRSRQRNYPEGK